MKTGDCLINFVNNLKFSHLAKRNEHESGLKLRIQKNAEFGILRPFFKETLLTYQKKLRKRKKKRLTLKLQIETLGDGGIYVSMGGSLF